MTSVGTALICPACNGPGLSITTVTHDIPYFGEVILSTVLCSLCGFRSTDVWPVKEKEPARYVLKVGSPSDLEVRVVRSPTTTITIPELGLAVEPGRSQDGYVTNVEGVLRRFLDAVRTLEKDLADDPVRKERARSISYRLEKVISGTPNGEEVLTVILEDPKGCGLMASKDNRVVKEPLSGTEGDVSG